MIENECKRFAFGSYILPPVISGRLNTKSSFNFQYGRIQIRAKLPRGDWLFPCEFYSVNNHLYYLFTYIISNVLKQIIFLF